MKDIRETLVRPGMWRPHHRFEHIAWIHPPWGDEEYLWLDFPEAVFTNQGLLFLSHTNPSFPVLFPDPPACEWLYDEGQLHYERRLPNDIRFAGRLCISTDGSIEMKLTFANESPESLTSIKLQTCLFMRAHHELGSFLLDNKYIHAASVGWVDLARASTMKDGSGLYRYGWRDGYSLADLPIIACKSSSADRYVAMTWFDDTYSLISNPHHPCIHADPAVPDLGPGDSYTLTGAIYFTDGSLEDVGRHYNDLLEDRQ